MNLKQYLLYNIYYIMLKLGYQRRPQVLSRWSPITDWLMLNGMKFTYTKYKKYIYINQSKKSQLFYYDFDWSLYWVALQIFVSKLLNNSRCIMTKWQVNKTTRYPDLDWLKLWMTTFIWEYFLRILSDSSCVLNEVHENQRNAHVVLLIQILENKNKMKNQERIA